MWPFKRKLPPNVIPIRSDVNWETDLCNQCCKQMFCQLGDKPCLPLEMLRQLVEMKPGDMVVCLGNVRNWFIY